MSNDIRRIVKAWLETADRNRVIGHDGHTWYVDAERHDGSTLFTWDDIADGAWEPTILWNQVDWDEAVDVLAKWCVYTVQDRGVAKYWEHVSSAGYVW